VFIQDNEKRKTNYGKIIVRLKPKQKWFHLMSELSRKPVSNGFIAAVCEVHFNKVEVVGDDVVPDISEADSVVAFVSPGVFFI
jgi:hypothetical protein